MASLAVAVLEALLLVFLGFCVGLMASNGEYRAQRTQRLSTQEEDFFYGWQTKPEHPRHQAQPANKDSTPASETSDGATRLNTPVVS
jgi:hypothetical protein